MTPFYFGSPALYGVLHLPRDAQGTNRGVVLCGPLGREGVGSHRPLRTLARELSERGWPTLQFDWPGYGESLGDSDEPQLVDSIIDALPQALDELRRQTGVTGVTVIGVGLGALLAAAAIARHGLEVDELVLWGAPRSGAFYLREQRAFQRLTTEETGPPPGGVPPLAEGAMEASGFLVSREAGEALSALDLGALELATVSRVLLLDGAADSSIAASLGTSVQSVERMKAGGIQLLLEPPGTSALDERSVAVIAGWLHQGEPAALPAATPHAMLAREDWSEDIVSIDGPHGPMVATLTRPKRLRTNGWVLLLNAGAVRRSGPNRLWTRWARAWARAGVPSLRLDARGIGDSDGTDVHATTLETMCTPELVSDVKCAIAYLHGEIGATSVVPVGLCSGAFAAFRTAVEEPAVPGAVMVNLQTTEWDPEEWDRDLAQHARRAVRRRGLIGSLLRLRTSGLRPLRRAARGHLTQLWGRRSGIPETAGSDLREELRRLVGRRAQMLFVFSSGDVGITYVTRRLGALESLEELGTKLVVVDGPDHTFRPLWSHDVLRQTVESHLALLGVLEPVAQDAA